MPLVITTTDLKPPHAKEEVVGDGSLRVRSRSGLHPTEKTLLSLLPKISNPRGHALVTGNRTGVLPIALRHRFPHLAVQTHAYDIYHGTAIARTLHNNGYAQEIHQITSAAIAPPLPDKLFALVLVQVSQHSVTNELLQLMLQNIHDVLDERGEMFMVYEGDAEWLRGQVKTVFGKTPVTVAGTMALVHVTAKKPLPRRRDFSATFTVALPNIEPFTITTTPGVFSHRRPDAGGLALAEVAAREVGTGERLLDIGCGSGLVGIALAKAQPDVHVTFVDSHASAVACSAANARANGLTKFAVECSATGATTGAFTLVVGNPPYFGNYAIAELFIRHAWHVLQPQGRCLIVAKHTAWHEEFMRELFGNAEVFARRNYNVVRSLRR